MLRMLHFWSQSSRCKSSLASLRLSMVSAWIVSLGLKDLDKGTALRLKILRPGCCVLVCLFELRPLTKMPLRDFKPARNKKKIMSMMSGTESEFGMFIQLLSTMGSRCRRMSDERRLCVPLYPATNNHHERKGITQIRLFDGFRLRSYRLYGLGNVRRKPEYVQGSQRHQLINS